MDENRIVELLARKLAGEASSEELGELAYLLSKYPDSVYYEELLEQVWKLRTEEKSEAEDAFVRHKARFSEELGFTDGERPVKSFVKRNAVWLGLAASILLFLGIFLEMYHQPATAAGPIEIMAGKGVRKEVVLPDGSTVRLNSDSKLSYQGDFTEGSLREVKLSGEAFFKVAHDKTRPFIVRTQKVAVRVLGTQFNVKEYPDEGNSETTLISGSVELSVNDREGQKFVLKPSEKLALVEKRNDADEARSTLRIEHVAPVRFGDTDYITEVSWVENKLLFQNETMTDLIPKLERWYNVKIDLHDQSLQNFRFTGIFVDENIVQALEAMKLIKSFNYKSNENGIEIY